MHSAVVQIDPALLVLSSSLPSCSSRHEEKQGRYVEAGFWWLGNLDRRRLHSLGVYSQCVVLEPKIVCL